MILFKHKHLLQQWQLLVNPRSVQITATAMNTLKLRWADQKYDLICDTIPTVTFVIRYTPNDNMTQH